MLEHYGWNLPGPRSGWITVKCNAHPDSHASCRVNNDIGAARCQACGWGGDVIKIIQYYEGEGTTYRDAVAIAERINGTGNNGVRRSPRGGYAVSRKQGDNRSDSAYVPPRLRGESR